MIINLQNHFLKCLLRIYKNIIRNVKGLTNTCFLEQKKQKVGKLEIKKIEKLGKEKKEQGEFSPTMKN